MQSWSLTRCSRQQTYLFVPGTAKAAEMKLPLYKLITHRYKLEEINEAMWTVVREEGLGIAVFNR